MLSNLSILKDSVLGVAVFTPWCGHSSSLQKALKLHIQKCRLENDSADSWNNQKRLSRNQVCFASSHALPFLMSVFTCNQMRASSSKALES